jgi:hypothetical protein
MSVTFGKIDLLVSQADQEGKTLAEILTRGLSSKDLDRLQKEVNERIRENYASIASFMSDVEAPSIPDFASMTEEQLTDFEKDVLFALSDDRVADVLLEA